MNNHLYLSPLLFSIASAYAMELQVVTDENTQNATTTLCKAIQNFNTITEWESLKLSLNSITDGTAKAAVARSLQAEAAFRKNQVNPLLCCFGGEELFMPVLYTASTCLATRALFLGLENYGVGAQTAAGALGGSGIFGVICIGVSSFLEKRRKQQAVWRIACEMEAIAKNLAPVEEV